MKIYFCDIAEKSDKEFTLQYERMSPQRKAKCRQIKNEIAKKCCIAADNLVRSALAEHLNQSPAEIEIRISPTGKPYLEGNPIYFSVSHSNTMVVCAVSQHPIGIDIEYIREVSSAAYKRICTENEWSVLNQTNPSMQNLRFIELWTRKEAVFKIEGALPRKDSETEVFAPKPPLNISSEIYGNYFLSVAEITK